jgi:thiol:disulfide interchange protein
MKNVQRFTLFLMLLLAVSGLKAQTPSGIQFFHGTFAEAQAKAKKENKLIFMEAKAKKENKLIFMDAYTSWCAPCRFMAANVFTDQSVGEYYNAHFVNLKVDMENGEGPDLSRRYSVMAYPTLLFIDGNGEVKSRTMGGKPASEFIALGQKVVKGN